MGYGEDPVSLGLTSFCVSPTELTNAVPPESFPGGSVECFVLPVGGTLIEHGWECHFPLLPQAVHCGQGQAVPRVSWAGKGYTLGETGSLCTAPPPASTPPFSDSIKPGEMANPGFPTYGP